MRWRNDLDKVLREEVDLGDPALARTRLLPRGIRMHDVWHVLFGGLGASLKACPAWVETEEGLRTIANFLRDQNLRNRFRA